MRTREILVLSDIPSQVKLLVKSIKGFNNAYCMKTVHPMDNSLSGRRRPARQMSEKDVLCLHRPGRSSTVHSPDGVSYFLPV